MNGRVGDLLMRNLLTLFILIASASGCAVASDEHPSFANGADPYAGLPSFLSTSSGHEAMMKMIHRRPKNGAFGATGS
jgi:hypothetical protein